MGRGIVSAFLVVIVTTAFSELVVPIDIGPVTVLTGGSVAGHQDGLLSTATYSMPHQVLVSPFDDGVVFVADNSNGVVRRIDLALSTVATFLGTGKQYDDPLASPVGLLTDPNDDRYLFVACLVGIRRADIEGATSSTFSGTMEGYAEGSASSARFRRVQGMVVQSTTLNLIVTDTQNHRIRASTASTDLLHSWPEVELEAGLTGLRRARPSITPWASCSTVKVPLKSWCRITIISASAP
jgi:hypothetical protein